MEQQRKSIKGFTVKASLSLLFSTRIISRTCFKGSAEDTFKTGGMQLWKFWLRR